MSDATLHQADKTERNRESATERQLKSQRSQWEWVGLGRRWTPPTSSGMMDKLGTVRLMSSLIWLAELEEINGQKMVISSECFISHSKKDKFSSSSVCTADNRPLILFHYCTEVSSHFCYTGNNQCRLVYIFCIYILYIFYIQVYVTSYFTISTCTLVTCWRLVPFYFCFNPSSETREKKSQIPRLSHTHSANKADSDSKTRALLKLCLCSYSMCVKTHFYGISHDIVLPQCGWLPKHSIHLLLLQPPLPPYRSHHQSEGLLTAALALLVHSL